MLLTSYFKNNNLNKTQEEELEIIEITLSLLGYTFKNDMKNSLNIFNNKNRAISIHRDISQDIVIFTVVNYTKNEVYNYVSKEIATKFIISMLNELH